MKNNIFNILKKELRETFRDKKSLSMMLITPFMIPLIVIGMSSLFDFQDNMEVTKYNKIGISYEVSNIEKEIINNLEIDAIYNTERELEKMYSNDELDLYITKENNKYIINGKNNERTAYASVLVETYISMYEEYLQREYLTNNNVNPDEILNMLTLETKYKEEENFYSNNIKIYAFLFIIMAITTASTYPATDTTAGEKERGTLETLLTFPIRNKDIIIGKFLSVSISSLFTGIFSLLLTIISLSISGNLFKIYEGVNMNLPFEVIIYSVIVIIAYSFLISGLCIAIGSKCKSFKEAQSALTPLTLICVFPGMIAFLVDIKTNILYSMIPFLNNVLLFKDILNGNVNLIYLLLMFISTIIIIFIVLSIIIRQYKTERILFSN